LVEQIQTQTQSSFTTYTRQFRQLIYRSFQILRRIIFQNLISFKMQNYPKFALMSSEDLDQDYKMPSQNV
jgi:hypothetical protein